MQKKQEQLISFFLQQGYLLSPDFLKHSSVLNLLSLHDPSSSPFFISFVSFFDKKEIIFLCSDHLAFYAHTLSDISFSEMESARAFYEKGMRMDIYNAFLHLLPLEASTSFLPQPSSLSQATPLLSSSPPDFLQQTEVLLPDFSLSSSVSSSLTHASSSVLATSAILEQQISYDLSSRGIEVLLSYNKESRKRELGDFVHYFTKRYEALEAILRNRQELVGLTAIQRILGKKEKEQVSLIGIIKDKRETKNGNIILVLEDKTGEITVIINKNKPEVYEEAKNTVLDEVVGIVGFSADRAVFCTSIVLPDVPLYHEIKKSPDEEYAIFLSDLHVGSRLFLREDFERFLQWLKGDLGNEKQRELVKKIKYVFIMGDLVDGVGIYPNQESELSITNIYEQYAEAARLLSHVPNHMTLIISPGNHDALRLSEPQPAFDQDFAKPLLQLKNALLVSNPALVTIGKKQGFPGFDVLLYHGYSFDYYIAEVDSIRNNGGYDRADLVMKFLLQRRHLAPTHGSSLYIPDSEEDPLVIKRVPDIFATGHLHKTSISQYRHVTLLCGSCWQSKTTFQEKVGHHPEPSRVPLINLQTREVKVLKFGDA